jgi:hypothetical protein
LGWIFTYYTHYLSKKLQSCYKLIFMFCGFPKLLMLMLYIRKFKHNWFSPYKTQYYLLNNTTLPITIDVFDPNVVLININKLKLYKVPIIAKLPKPVYFIELNDLLIKNMPHVFSIFPFTNIVLRLGSIYMFFFFSSLQKHFFYFHNYYLHQLLRQF